MSTPAPSPTASNEPATPKVVSPTDGVIFEAQVTSVAGDLLRAIRGVLEAVPTTGTGPQALARTLGVDKVLASRVLKATRTDDPINVAYRMPGPDPLRRLVRAAAKRGVPTPLAGSALDAIDRFEGLIRDLAGDRSLLDSILSAWIPDARREFELRRKQAAFKAISQIKGVQAEATVATVVISPSATPERLDVVWINGLTGLHRVRPGATVKLVTRRVTEKDRARLPQTLDGRAIDDPATLLLSEFCSAPTPRLEVRRAGASIIYTLAENGFGSRSAVDLVFAEVNRSELPRYPDPLPGGRPRKAFFFADVMTPSVMLQFDLLVHESLWQGQTPGLRVYDTSFEGVASANDPARDIDLLDVNEAVESLGLGLSRMRSPDVPRYLDLLRHVFTQASLDASAFRAWRIRVDYPIHGSQVTATFDAATRQP